MRLNLGGAHLLDVPLVDGGRRRWGTGYLGPKLDGWTLVLPV